MGPGSLTQVASRPKVCPLTNLGKRGTCPIIESGDFNGAERSIFLRSIT